MLSKDTVINLWLNTRTGEMKRMEDWFIGTEIPELTLVEVRPDSAYMVNFHSLGEGEPCIYSKDYPAENRYFTYWALDTKDNIGGRHILFYRVTGTVGEEVRMRDGYPFITCPYYPLRTFPRGPDDTKR